MKKYIALGLILALLCSMLPGAALADEAILQDNPVIQDNAEIGDIEVEDETPEEEPELLLDEETLEDIDLTLDGVELADAEMLTVDLENAAEQAEAVAQPNAPEDFEIDANGVLVKYKGPGGNVVIPDNVTSIGDSAFFGCTTVITIFIPDSVSSIGSHAFYECTNLNDVAIPNTVTSIEPYTFRYCTNLKSVVIPNSVSCIKDYAFDLCTSLDNVTIPDSVTSIGIGAFAGCTSLKNLTISNNLTRIETGAFCGCVSLENVQIPNGVNVIGIIAFAACTNLVTITIPNTVYHIESNAFNDCSNLTIYGEAGSYAETYARNNGIRFIGTAPQTQLTFPIIISNINESNPEKYASFDAALENYVYNQDRSSEKYCSGLAHMLMALSAAAYNAQGAGTGQLTVEKDGYASDSKALYHITKAFLDLGFSDYQSFNYYSDPNASAYGSDNAAFTIGQKQLPNGEALVLIVVRGSFGNPSDMTSDWLSNFRIDADSSGRHYGFATAADKVYSLVISWLKDRYHNDFIKSNIRYVITGHSRGAAVANLLAVRLHDAGVPNSKVYDYNFACPDTVRGFTLDDLSKNHKNIWNINNTADAIGVIPGVVGDHLDYVISKAAGLFANWNKYGTTFFYCNNWDKAAEFDLARTFSGNSTHDYAKYVRDLSKIPSKFYKWVDVVARRAKLGVEDTIGAIIQAFYPKYAATSLIMAKVTVKDQVYSGKTLKPTVTVKYNNITLRKGKDYTLAYKNNKNIGTATITVTGKGKYAGKRTVSFKIIPKSVTGLILMAGSKKIKVTWKNAKGVSGYQIQYALKKTFLSAQEQWVDKASSKESVILGLKKGKTYYVRIRACKKVNGEEYWSAWSSTKKTKVK